MSRKRVIINIYVESSSIADSQYRFDQLKRTHHQANEFISRPNTKRTKGYDRRAQLLAYANELRNDKSTQPQCCNNPKQKHKKRRWTRRIGLSFPRLFRRKNNKERRYERMGTEDYCDANEGKNMSEENEKATSNFCRKLKCFLKDISCRIWRFGKK